MKSPGAVAAALGSTLAILFALSGCGSPSAPVGTSSYELAASGAATWSNVSYGINVATVSAGPNVLVVYGGYSATDADSEALSLAYVSAQLGALGVGQIYAVRGPEDADYSSREIGNSTLAASLATQTAASTIVVVAHSSGGFVADELFTFASDAVLAKVAYFNLDGGSYAMNSA